MWLIQWGFSVMADRGRPCHDVFQDMRSCCAQEHLGLTSPESLPIQRPGVRTRNQSRLNSFHLFQCSAFPGLGTELWRLCMGTLRRGREPRPGFSSPCMAATLVLEKTGGGSSI